MRAPGGTSTFLSTMALRTTAPRPTLTPFISTDPVTRLCECTFTPGESTERCTSPPETTTPAQTIESSACPIRPGSENTNFAGGNGGFQVRIGHSLL